MRSAGDAAIALPQWPPALPRPPRPAVDFVIAAHDEAATVGAVARAVRDSPSCGLLIVVADACHDATAAEARSAGAWVIETDAHNKGTAMALGLEHVTASRVGFVDADIEGLRPEHIDALAQFPDAMTVGTKAASPELIARTPLPPIGGERVLPASLARRANLADSGYEAEMKLNLAAKQMGIPIVEVPMPGVRHRSDADDLDPIKQLRLWAAVVRGYFTYGRSARPRDMGQRAR